MNEQLQQLVIQLVQAAMQGDQKAQQTIEQIMGAAQQGDEQATQIAQMIQAVAQQMQQGLVQAAKFGAKLDYTRQLRGLCPEGYEMQYFKSGGRLCKKCVAKQKKMEEGGEVPSNPVDSFKCGRKMKKVEKHLGGKTIETPKMKQEYYDVDGRNIIRTINKEIPDTSIVVREPIKGRKNSYINYIMTKDDNNIPQTNYPPYNDMLKELWWKLINGYLDNKK